MKHHYSLQEIKKELLQEISELEKKDPYWLNCRHCPRKGKCCIDNDIDIRDDEWEEIKSFLDQNEKIWNQVKKNFLAGSKCYFHTEKCCLIEKIRPTNCLYTPYQVIQNEYDQEIMFSIRNKECDFTTKTEKCKPLPPEAYLIYLEEAGHTYLLLNHWYLEFEEQSDGCFKEEGYWRLKDYFQM